MSGFFGGLGVVIALELRQRVRGIGWYALLAIFFILVLVVTVIVWSGARALTEAGGDASQAGSTVYSAIIYFVLLLGALVAPALSGNAINGDRDAGTLATTQVTLLTTGQLVLGKFLAAWISALAFLVASVPFIAFSAVTGGLEVGTFFVSLLVLAFELGVVAAIGVGLSGLLNRPLFSIVVTYLTIAAFGIGSLLVVGLGGLAVQTPVSYSSTTGVIYDNATGRALTCTPPEKTTYSQPRFDYFWGALAANPFVVLGDATPTTYDKDGQPVDLFGVIKVQIRSLQIPAEAAQDYDECNPPTYEEYTPPIGRDIINKTVPSWFIGMLAHLVLAVAAMVGAWAKLRTPARRLGAGSRIA